MAGQTIYQKGTDSVYDSGGQTFYANGPNAGKVYTAPAVDTPIAAPAITTPIPMSQGYTTPVQAAPPVMAADTLKNAEQPYKVPTTQPTVPSDYYSKILASLPTATDIVNTQSAAQVDTAATQSSLSSKISDVLSRLTGRSAAQATAESNAGIPDLTKNLAEVTAQITALKNDAAAIPLQEQNNAEGRGVTTAGLAPIEAADLRRNAIKALGLSSIAATLQGNLTIAQAQADRAVKAEFDPLQSELDYLKQIYTLNQDAMSTADKKQSDIIQAKLKDRQDALDVAKSDRTSVIENANKAAANGAPASVVSKALDLGLEDAMKILTPYLKTPVKPTTSSTGIPNITSAQQTALKNALTASKFQGPQADGKYADPSLYLANYQSYIQSGGNASDFFRLFPPATYINPKNTWLPPEIMDFVPKPKTISDNPFAS